MTVFWPVADQFDPASAWWLVGGVQGRRWLHVLLEGPSPDPREPQELHRVPPPGSLRFGSGSRPLTDPPASTAPPPRYPLYALALHLPSGDPLPFRGASRHGSRSSMVMNAEFESPQPDVMELTVTLLDDAEVLATGRLSRLGP